MSSFPRAAAWALLAASFAVHGQVAERASEGCAWTTDENVEHLLHAIDRIEGCHRSSARAYLELAAGHDSNANSAPGVSSVAVPAHGGSILELDPAGTRKGGNFGKVAAGVSGRLVLGPRLSLIGTLTARSQQFNGAIAHSGNEQIDGNAGATFRVGQEEYTLAGQFGTLRIDGDRVRDSRGVVGEWTHRFDGYGQFNAYFEAGRLAYPAQDNADARRNVVGATYAHQTSSSVWAYAGMYYGRENPLDPAPARTGNMLAGLRGGVQVPVQGALYGFLSGGYERRRYDGENPLFLTVRRDDQVNVSAGMYWIPAPGWRVTPQVLWIRTDSTVPLAQYQKRAVSIAVLREF